MSNPYLSLPLDGVRAIEASAGTGKTFTLATLVVRLVVEGRMQVGEILAVTFTEAATQELRARIRQRLLLAAGIAAGGALDDASGEAKITRALIDAHLAKSDESPAAMRRRLREAADSIDLAAIFTIHGFCARVLREHALESGQGFDAPDLLANDRDLREAIAADLWRAHAVDDDSVEALAALWSGGPEALASDLARLVREPVLLPPEPGPLPDPMPMLRAAGEAFADAGRAHGDDFRAALVSAVQDKVLNGNSYRLAWIEELFAALRAWCNAGDPGQAFEHDKLVNLRRETLRAKTNGKAPRPAPDSPFCDAVEAYVAALAEVADIKERRKAALLHRIRADARRRLAKQKRQLRVQTYDDLIDRVADAIDGPQADALADRLRAQYRVALVDEFQDTDPRQWRIFDRVFGGGEDARHPPALFVIGDPKQAIYGFRGGDVETYLAARATAEEAPPLAHNFRSRPAVLGAVDALYAQAQETLEAQASATAGATAKAGDGAAKDASAGEGVEDDGNAEVSAFVDPRIRFHPIEPGGNRDDADYQRNGSAAPALTLWLAPEPQPDDKGNIKPYSAGDSRDRATAGCVAAIHGVLSEARAGKATIKGRPVQPGDIAVLVRKHSEATRIREALARVGIPAVAAGKQSLFATSEAREVHVLLLALLHHADARRLRTALCTVLIGLDAKQLAALDDDGDALQECRTRALGWRDRLQQGGPLSLLTQLCAEHAPRLLGLLDGERRLTNYLQLAELLQEAQRQALGAQGLVDWLARRISEASADDEDQQLRLESDARRVQVVTLHKSKGLEYPLVFLPYAGVGGKDPDPGRSVVVHAEGGRVLQWKLEVDGSDWSVAREAWLAAQRAEDARLLYVGLTRARDALWLASGKFFNHAKTSQWPMVSDTKALAKRGDGRIVIDDAPPPESLPWLPPQAEGDVPDARTPTRSLASDWWVYSFTQLAKTDATHDPSSAATQPAEGGRDEADIAGEDLTVVRDDGSAPQADDVTSTSATDASAAMDIAALDPRFGGTRFGVVLHEVLELTDFARWQSWRPGDDVPDTERTRIIEALGRGGYAEDGIEAGIAVLTALAGHTLTVVLPEGTTLAALPETQRRAEIEFQFSLAPTPVSELMALLHRHGLLRDRDSLANRRRLEGLMTGLIDLTYMHDGRWYVLDYKSNRLPGYGTVHMEEAMAHHAYPLQALIYTVALHRWLRFRLGDAAQGGGYDYARDFGGVRYLFCRGLDAVRADSPGVQAWTFSPELVHAVDALFAGASDEVAA